MRRGHRELTSSALDQWGRGAGVRGTSAALAASRGPPPPSASRVRTVNLTSTTPLTARFIAPYFTIARTTNFKTAFLSEGVKCFGYILNVRFWDTRIFNQLVLGQPSP
ncbi:hypothetical protein B5X24_HaOG204408 [Helicoverpa armigera]|uniref:Uncharacterized protein n=1 Tax=Helicoverpa armigera TaxID=29058 RepID=A0A2W1BV36_HELAM|nr:hypothetical protein B5X24_HaOG204408 [Helicoverpa armigera]